MLRRERDPTSDDNEEVVPFVALAENHLARLVCMAEALCETRKWLVGHTGVGQEMVTTNDERARLEALRRTHGYFLPKGDTLVRQDEAGGYLYVILAGALDCIRQDPGKPRSVVRTAREGELFGVTSCFTGMPHSVTAVAQGDTRLLRFRRDGVDALAEASPTFAMKVIETLVERLRDATDRDLEARITATVSKGPVANRVAPG